MWTQYSFLFPRKPFQSVLLGPLPSENRRHTPDDAPEAGRALFECPGLTDQVQQLVEHHEDAVVGFGRRDLEEAAVGRERQEAAFLTGYGTPVLQVSFIPYDDERGGAGELLLCLADALDLLSHHVEARPVADAVDQDEAVGPLQLPVADVTRLFSVLQKEDCEMRTFRVVTSHLGQGCLYFIFKVRTSDRLLLNSNAWTKSLP